MDELQGGSILGNPHNFIRLGVPKGHNPVLPMVHSPHSFTVLTMKFLSYWTFGHVHVKTFFYWTKPNLIKLTIRRIIKCIQYSSHKAKGLPLYVFQSFTWSCFCCFTSSRCPVFCFIISFLFQSTMHHVRRHLTSTKNLSHACTVKPASAVTSFKQSPVLRGNFFLVLL